MSETPSTVPEIIDLLASRDLLSEVGITNSHARTIKARGRLPGHLHAAIVEIARLHGLPIEYELLAKLAAAHGHKRVSSAAVGGDQ